MLWESESNLNSQGFFGSRCEHVTSRGTRPWYKPEQNIRVHNGKNRECHGNQTSVWVRAPLVHGTSMLIEEQDYDTYQICNLIFFPWISIVFILKSIPCERD